MSRTCQILSVVLFVVSCVFIWQALSDRPLWTSVNEEHIKSEDGSSVKTDTERSRTIYPSIYSNSLHNQSNYERAKSTPSPFTRKIVAIGDMHGDLEKAKDALRVSEVMNVRGEWSGKVDILVQTGDIIDRGVHTIELFLLMDKLRSEAEKVGGLVLSLMGNHEYINLLQIEKQDPAEIKTFGGSKQRWERLTKGDIGKLWAKYYKAALRLPLHPSLGPPNTDYDPKKVSPLSHAAISFVHGGIAPSYPKRTPFPSAINELGKSATQKLQNGRPDKLTDAEVELTQRKTSPLWYRGWANLPETKAFCIQAERLLGETGTRLMVMGHTPQPTEILSRCGGKIFIIDTGMTSYYGGPSSALSIVYTLNPAPEPTVDAKSTTWKEKVVVKAIYVGREQELANFERDVVGDFA